MNTRLQPNANGTATPEATSTSARVGLLQRKCACGGGGAASLSDDCQDCSKKKLSVQRHAANQSAPAVIPDIVEQALRSPGKPLDSLTREFVQSRFGHDFSRVSVVTQSKLAVSEPGDRYEQEADRMAGHVMRASAPTVPERSEVNAPDVAKPSAPDLAHAPDVGEVRGQLPTELVQRKAESSSSGHPSRASVEGGGEARSATVENSHAAPRSVFDFGKVRVHTDERAAEAARSLNARAFTLGHDIVFGAGEYRPETDGGRFLLAHELTHVLQQSESNPQLVQRTITVQNPGAQTPNIPIPWASMTNAEIVQRWLDQLCSEGMWTVDGATGVVAAKHTQFCADPPTPPYNHHSFSSTPTSCGCLCATTTSAAPDIRLHAANFVNLPSGPFDVNAAGEGRTRPADAAAGRPEINVGVSGLHHVGVTGAGDTSPHSGAGRTQVIGDPPWIILGHELCGHARLGRLPHAGHATTPEGDQSAVDVENLIRREHSTVANNLGIRRGEFTTADGARHFGSVYQSGAGETIATIATKVGIAAADRLNHIWRENGTPITAATENTLAANERLLIENVFWHQVITGETAQSIATMWGIPLASLQRANPALAGATPAVTVGQRLLIPAS